MDEEGSKNLRLRVINKFSNRMMVWVHFWKSPNNWNGWLKIRKCIYAFRREYFTTVSYRCWCLFQLLPISTNLNHITGATVNAVATVAEMLFFGDCCRLFGFYWYYTRRVCVALFMGFCSRYDVLYSSSSSPSFCMIFLLLGRKYIQIEFAPLDSYSKRERRLIHFECV